MIMVPAHQNFFNQQQQQQKINDHCIGNGYVGCGDSYTGTLSVMSSRTLSWYDYGGGETCLGSDHLAVVDHHHHRMAEDESRSTSSVNESGSSSKGTNTPTKEPPQNKEDIERWLQLGLGGGSELKLDRPIEPRTGHDLIELDLFSGANNTQHVKPPLITATNTSNNTTTTTMISTPSTLFLQHPRTSFSFLHQQEVSWGYRPNSWNPTASTSTSSLLPNLPTMSMQYYPQRFHQNPVLDIIGPSNSDFRVIDPPRRPHSGVWVILQASQNQEKEPFLPQIPKNYLRIKDGKTTVQLLTKYLVNKLRLNSESEIEIRCRGEELEPCLTLQHVRDNIWISSTSSSRSSRSSSSSDHSVVTLFPNNSSSSSPKDHVMILHYGTGSSKVTT